LGKRDLDSILEVHHRLWYKQH